MPTPKELLHFSKDKYLNTIAEKYSGNTALAKEIYKKRAKKLSFKAHTGMGVLASTVTGGGALVGSALAGREFIVENQKLEMLEAEWASRGHPKLPEGKFKDKILPISIAVGTSLFAAGMDVALAGASPDQFYQFTPDGEVNAYIVSNYYTAVDQGLGTVGHFVQNKVVTAGRGEGYDDNSSSGNNSDDGSDEKYNEDEKYDDGNDDNSDSEDEDSNRGQNSKRYSDDDD